MVRLRTSDGFFITAVQARTHDRRQCDEANERFLAPIRRGCPTCVVESVDCDGPLHGFEKALASGAAGAALHGLRARDPARRWSARPGGAKTSCEAIADANRGHAASRPRPAFTRGRPRRPRPLADKPLSPQAN